MEEIASRDYHSDDAVFKLPPQLKDKTMHMFTLSDDGPSEFSLVVSRADTQPEEQLEDFGDRLLKELGRALPKFQLKGMIQRTVDNSPATELAFSWRNDGVFMHQRQVMVLVAGPTPGSTQALLLAATCLKAFSDEWNEAFDKLLGSVKLRRPLIAAAAPDDEASAEPVHTPAMLPIIFALSVRERCLHVFGDQQEACAHTSAVGVEDGSWSFFDADGRRLQVKFTIPNSGTIWRKPGKFRLLPFVPGDGPLLVNCLPHVIDLKGDGLFMRVDDVLAHLQGRAALVAQAER